MRYKVITTKTRVKKNRLGQAKLFIYQGKGHDPQIDFYKSSSEPSMFQVSLNWICVSGQGRSQNFEKVGKVQNINVIHVKHVYAKVMVSNGRTD